MAENENGGLSSLRMNDDGCGELIALAGLAIVIGLPVLIKSIFDWLTARNKLKSRLPNDNLSIN
ncbi:hypothetical protein [Candidatus Kuenenia stuttgartiensis]|uniref:Uncharacterized protein n=1 Tax=Kuenenia stuttgartiensis TaxID=174633 RepID=Q1Q561_KUEST|nr:hypothetical protein [Candidatus Kuenenia stuttgartiensis]CAJ75144.1 unknown protein [Candidatus Kuenenia stuttgartiensis]